MARLYGILLYIWYFLAFSTSSDERGWLSYIVFLHVLPISYSMVLIEVAGYALEEQLGRLSRVQKIIILAGVPRKPGMTDDDLFTGLLKRQALVNMISNPVNSVVPISTEVFKRKGEYDGKKLFGVTTLDVERAKTFYSGKANANVAGVNVPVVGGHARITILPLFSQVSPPANLSDDDIKALTK